MKFVADNAILDRMQKVRSVCEIQMFLAAAQLVSIATQAAYHVTKPGVTDQEIYATCRGVGALEHYGIGQFDIACCRTWTLIRSVRPS